MFPDAILKINVPIKIISCVWYIKIKVDGKNFHRLLLEFMIFLIQQNIYLFNCHFLSREGKRIESLNGIDQIFSEAELLIPLLA